MSKRHRARSVDRIRYSHGEIGNHVIDEYVRGGISRRAFLVKGTVVGISLPALSAIIARLCDDFIDDCEKVMLRWNRVFQTQNIDYSLKLPHRAFNRAVGEFADVHATVDGELVSESEWQERKHAWMASDSDLEYILSLMQQEKTPGKYANWIAAPRAGINGQPGDFEYVKVAA